MHTTLTEFGGPCQDNFDFSFAHHAPSHAQPSESEIRHRRAQKQAPAASQRQSQDQHLVVDSTASSSSSSSSSGSSSSSDSSTSSSLSDCSSMLFNEDTGAARFNDEELMTGDDESPRRVRARSTGQVARASPSSRRGSLSTQSHDPAAWTTTTPASSSSSSSSTSSYVSTSSTHRAPGTPHAASAPKSTSPPINEPILHPEELLSPIEPPPNSFASAQAAMAAQNSSHSQNLIGHSIDNSSKGYPSRLEFISILGLGAYGVVYLARDILARPSAFPASRSHPSLGNQPLYAVKCLNKVGLDERQRSFQTREIALHAKASPHGNVVTLHNVIDEETCIYVVLQFCEEGDLFGMITERQRYLGDDELIRNVFLQIVDAVEYCHQNSIYHRDLKPENILCLDDGKKVVLADFGLATDERSSGDFGCGSTFYMSPECQGGLFQRLQSYSTPHNDVWSLGVILVNLTCGRNPWKQACPSDETFCAYLGNPDFLRSILPISEHTNRILKRIFALNPKVRISLKELRREILSVKTFVMTEDELRHATQATKEAARAFAQGIADDAQEEIEEDGEETFEDFEDAQMADVHQQQHEDYDNRAWREQAAPATPIQTLRAAAPITPPATPRRAGRPSKITPVPHRSSLKASFSRGSSESDEGSSDTLTSDEEATPNPRRRRRSEVFTTPPSSQSAFDVNGPIHSHNTLPPSPVTPVPNRRPRSQRSGSPRSAFPSRPPKSSITGPRRQRKTSFDSSSSSSGASASQPPTPTGPPVYSHPANILPPFATNVHPYDQEMSYATHGAFEQKTHHEVHTAYYPVSSDWEAASADQASHYSVVLPPPVFLPACTESEDGTPFEFPLPPTGYYHRQPVPAGETPRVQVFESSF